MATKKKKGPPGNIVAQNRKARRDYTIVEDVEAGVMLTGTEVKSLRQGRGSLVDAYAAERTARSTCITPTSRSTSRPVPTTTSPNANGSFCCTSARSAA
jgi:hypothetical protein